jgi:hypothetical protein
MGALIAQVGGTETEAVADQRAKGIRSLQIFATDGISSVAQKSHQPENVGEPGRTRTCNPLLNPEMLLVLQGFPCVMKHGLARYLALFCAHACSQIFCPKWHLPWAHANRLPRFHASLSTRDVNGHGLAIATVTGDEPQFSLLRLRC